MRPEAMTAPSALLPLARLLVAGRPAGHPVCRDGDRVLAWEDFAARVAGLAALLAGRREQRWALCCEHPLDFAVALFAVWHSGRRPVLPPNFQAGTLARLRTAFDGVLTGAKGSLDLPTVCVDAAPAAPRALSPLDAAAALDLYTSGSSGEPKRVAKSLAQLDAEVATQAGLWGPALETATVVGTVPHHHIYGLLLRLLLPLAAGRPFDAAACPDPEALLARLQAVGEAVVVSSPALLGRMPDLIELERLGPAARLILSSGAPLPASAAACFQRRLGRAPTEIYGSTETGGIAWRRQEGEAAWTPLPGVEIAAAEGGALRVRSPFLADREWLALEDGGSLLADGRFLLGGRLDRVVKLEGKRLSLPDMEARLRLHPWVADAGLLALPAAPGRRQLLGAALALTPLGHRQLADRGRRQLGLALRRHLCAWFEPVLLPRRWRFVEALPVNDRGKLTTAALVNLFREPDDAHPAA